MKKKPVPVLIPFLILVSMLFIGILIFAYVETKKANPQMIEVGAARQPLPTPRGYPGRGSDWSRGFDLSRDRGTPLGSGALVRHT
jgi:hypothetical protein